jgi:pantothenate kinase
MTLSAPEEFADRLAAMPIGQRRLVALAGPPGAGKSTLAEALVQRLNAQSPGRAAILPMDGYHFDDRVLEARGLRPRKGAPHTFDVGGLASMLQRLRANTEPEIAVPVLDRSIEIARAGAALIPQSVDIVLVEGNYVLLNAAPWDQLAPLFDTTAMIRINEAELRRRLLARWLGHGLDQAAAAEKVEANDLPNGLTVLRDSRAAEVEIDGTKPAKF